MPTTTVTPAEPETMLRDGAYTLECTCGERVTYQGEMFTTVEAQRHRAWHARQANPTVVAGFGPMGTDAGNLR